METNEPVYRKVLQRIYKEYYGDSSVPSDVDDICWEINEVIKVANDGSFDKQLRSTQVISSIVILYEKGLLYPQ